MKLSYHFSGNIAIDLVEAILQNGVCVVAIVFFGK